MRKLASNLSISLIALVLCFALGEASFRLLGFDGQLEFEVDDQLYWKFRPNQVGFVWMGDATFRSPETRINNLGTRGRDVTLESTAAVPILALGDSYTFGSGVRDDETFSAVLERELGAKRVDVINGGVPGYGIFQAQRLLLRLTPLLHPRIVVLTVPTGDVARQPFESAQEARDYLAAERRRKQLRSASKLVTFLHRKYYYVRARFVGESPAVPNEMLRADHARFANLWRKDQARLAEMANACRQSGASLVVMAWPQGTHAEWDNLVIDGIRATAAQDDIVGLVELRRALAKHPADQLTIPGDGHPSAMAHREAGIYLAGGIEKLISRAYGNQD